ncbi:MAG: bifunctional UDP-sugar hydrolase/5'-nucleotidase [Candidatus Eremiobacterota bacterium]
MQIGSRLNVTAETITSAKRTAPETADVLNPQDSVRLGEEKNDSISQQMDALSSLMALINGSKKNETTPSVDETAQNDPDIKDVNIIYTGDIHGAITPMPDKEYGVIGGVSNMAHVINKLKKEDNWKYALVDAGDWSQGSLESNMNRGKTMLEVMDSIGYDAVEIGNHEFDWGRESLDELISKTKVPLVGANILKEDGTLLDNVKPYVIKEINGVKVGMLGVLADTIREEGDPRKVEGLTFSNTIETTKKYISELKSGGVDLVVVLSHEGDEYDRKLASELSNVIIVGGHSHNQTIEEVNGNIIVKSGTQGKNVGHLKLKVKKDEHKIIGYENKFIPVTENLLKSVSLKMDSGVEDIVTPVIMEAQNKKSQVIGETNIDLTHDRLKVEESVMGDFVADAIRVGTNSDIGMIVSSGVRDQILRGKITFGDVYRILPRDDASVCLDLTGEQIKKLMENSARQHKNYLQISGMTVDIDREKPAGEQVSNIKVNGEPVDMTRAYRVAINDITFTGSCGYDEFPKGKNVEFGRIQRDILVDYIKANPCIDVPPQKGRINFIN